MPAHLPLIRPLLHRLLLIATISLFAISQSWAQGRTARVSGKVETMTGTVLVLGGVQGQLAVNLTPTTRLYTQVSATLADIRPGSFLGVGAMPQADGSQQAIRVMIFPEAMRGQGEGHRPWDRPGTTMTNATVETAVTQISGQVLTVKYKDGEQKIVIRPDAEILTYVDADRRALKPGAAVTVSGVVGEGTAMDAERIIIGR